MFVLRVKILLGLVIALSIVILLRTWQVEVLQHDQWTLVVSRLARDDVIVEPARGKIQDFKGRDLALDVACLDAAVDYRAIIKDPDWIKALARTRLGRRGDYLAASRVQRAQMLTGEIAHIGELIDAMWPALAKLSGRSVDEIEEIRSSIIHRVELRKRVVWYNLYKKELERQPKNKEPSPWYKRWLIDVSQEAPELDSIQVTVGEEQQAHPVLRDISSDIGTELGHNPDDYPGLVMRDDSHRFYTEPASTCACFILGHLSNVTADDLKDDPNVADKLQRYLPNDLIGRDGLEKLAEPMLRGSKGRTVRSDSHSQPVEALAAVPGEDVRSTIDLDLQFAGQQLLRHIKVRDPNGQVTDCTDLHGAIVVIDVPTGEVRALVSNPGFDLNNWENEWAALREDDINRPTLNRATLAQIEPGSTAKPMVGSTAVTRHFLRLDDTIECTGYLVIDGKPQQHGRCWTMNMWHVGHHQTWPSPHPTGFLTLPEALERSCNVFFETVASRMGLEELNAGFRNFGLGSPTGIGIAEAAGLLPPRTTASGASAWRTWCAGMGQGLILATPIQMANVAATLARNGVWIRPHLLMAGPQGIAEGRDLGLTPEALAAVKEGMMRVVNGAAGTGPACKKEEPGLNGLIVAAKTGSAQTGKFSVAARDAEGHPIKGAPRIIYEPGAFPWYPVGNDHQHLAHAWYIGYAPADHPRLAFAVLVEYGGSGGTVAGSVAREMLAACIEHGYLSHDTKMSP